jgi:Flp pilus assembly secretin CpaC
MAWLTARAGRGAGRVGFIALVGCAMVACFMRSASAAEVSVIVDQAKLIKLPEKVATIVVGNPMVADISLQPGGVVVITGKSYGTTNMLALDRGGNVLTERLLTVVGPTENVVVVYRGVERATYSCNPDCDPRITLGDSRIFFETAINQTMIRSGAAQAGATK